MDNSGEVADLMVKESIQLTEAAVKMLAAGSKNLAAFLMALSPKQQKTLRQGQHGPAASNGPGTQDLSQSKRATWRTSGPTPRKMCCSP